MSDEKTRELRKRLKNMLDGDRLRETAHAIELRSQDLGDEHFVFSPEAQTLAAMDEDKLVAFFDDVLEIRRTLAARYKQAAEDLILGDDNE